MSIENLYQNKIDSGVLRADADQHVAVSHMQNLFDAIDGVDAGWQKYGRYHRWVYLPETRPLGFYFYGTVGRGKSMLMQLFFDALDVPKRRVHFHKFMDEIHARMNAQQTSGLQDPVHSICEEIAENAQVLCFDEFYISNIADAMMLGRVLEKLVACGVVVCATSNWAPEDLFTDGHNRMMFKPFIKQIQQMFNVVSLGDGTDWRRKNGDELPHVYAGQGHDLSAVFSELSSHTSLDDTSISVVGATLNLLGHAPTSIHVSFGELCGKDLAAEHYIHLAETYHHIVLEGVPMLDETLQDAAMRFVVLIDILYEHGNALICQTEKPLEELCPEGDSAFAFERTVSRIIEMQGRV